MCCVECVVWNVQGVVLWSVCSVECGVCCVECTGCSGVECSGVECVGCGVWVCVVWSVQCVVVCVVWNGMWRVCGVCGGCVV